MKVNLNMLFSCFEVTEHVFIVSFYKYKPCSQPFQKLQLNLIPVIFDIKAPDPVSYKH